MNRVHRWYCNREGWKRHVREELVPPALEGLELGDSGLEERLVEAGFEDVAIASGRDSFRFRGRRVSA